MTWFLMSIFALANAQDPVLAPGDEHVNGCGPEWLTFFKPDRIDFLGVNFGEACAEHDRCYSRCVGRRGEIGCEQDIMSVVIRRRLCDDKLRAEMDESCQEQSFPRSASCRLTSVLFDGAVRLGGSLTFDGRQIDEMYRRAAAGEDIGATLDGIQQLVEERSIPSLGASRAPLRIDLSPSGEVRTRPGDLFRYPAHTEEGPALSPSLGLDAEQLREITEALLGSKKKLKLDEEALSALVRQVEQRLLDERE